MNSTAASLHVETLLEHAVREHGAAHRGDA